MRLLEVRADSTFSLVNFVGCRIPCYAILSHTWEPNNQEVTLQDFVNGNEKTKAGYKKIRFCGEQAQRDGLQYFWVDSCCIDQSSSADLSKAINSMYHWYRNAARCYVYLSDISARKDNSSSQLSWESLFTQSRWFTRGWTLQELLAPLSVDFFSQEGIWLGDRKSLEPQVHQATGITIQALQGNTLSHFSVEDRMGWATKRKTTVEEDQAYCLIGLLDISLPIIYGEGKTRAFRRLKEEVDKISNDGGLSKGNSRYY
jgi:hypothetical protein